MNLVEVINQFLIVFTTSTRSNPYLIPLLGQEPVARQVIEFRGIPTAVVLLIEHNVKLTQCVLLLYF